MLELPPVPQGERPEDRTMTHRQPWTERERRLIRQCFEEEKSDVVIGVKLDRSVEAVQVQRLALGLKRVPWANHRERMEA